MKLELPELRPLVAISMISWMIGIRDSDRVTFPCRRGHQYCTISQDFYCVEEAFEALAKFRRETCGISAPGTPSGSIKAT